jgi:hypothetical protein
MERIQNGGSDICPVSVSRGTAALTNFALVAQSRILQRSERFEFSIPLHISRLLPVQCSSKNPPVLGVEETHGEMLAGWATHKFGWIFGAEIGRTPLWVNTLSRSIVLALQW